MRSPSFQVISIIMRVGRILVLICLVSLLTACATSLLVGNVQSRLMWSLLQSLVGFNPHEINLLENSLIKGRMQVLLGNYYEPTVRLLNTANELQQEGALFYLVSRYAPPQVQTITDKAGFVWNADTNQMAVLLIQDGLPQVFTEPLEDALGPIIPHWPQELADALRDAEAYQESLHQRAVEVTHETLLQTLGLDAVDEPLVQELLKGKSAEDLLQERLEREAEELGDELTPWLSPLPQQPDATSKPSAQEHLP